MTTKKVRRAQVEAKRAAYDAETKRMGMVAQQKDRAKRQQVLKQAATGMKKRKREDIPPPENMLQSYNALFRSV